MGNTMLQVTFQPKAGNRERWEILVDGEKWREVHRSIFGRSPSLPPISDENELQGLFNAYEYRRVKGYVLWRLSTQTYHSEQLAKLLRDRLVQNHAIDQVIREYQEIGALDDEASDEDIVAREHAGAGRNVDEARRVRCGDDKCRETRRRATDRVIDGIRRAGVRNIHPGTPGEME